MLDHAVKVATSYHDGQYRDEAKGIRLPYIFHPYAVMKKVWEWGIYDEEVLVIALFHDLLEDTDIQASFIAKEFGSKVLDRVIELTFVPDPLKNKKNKYLQSFKNKSIESFVVKVADRICNLDDTRYSNPGYTKKYFEKANFLWGLLKVRKSEIINTFGAEVEDKMFFDYERIKKMSLTLSF